MKEYKETKHRQCAKNPANIKNYDTWKLQLSSKSSKGEKVKTSDAFVHSNKSRRAQASNPELIFHTLQRSEYSYPVTYATWGNEGSYSESLHFYARWICPSNKQEAPLTPLCIKKCTPKSKSDIFYNSLATGQCNSKWSVESPSFLHMQHQSTTMIRHLLING